LDQITATLSQDNNDLSQYYDLNNEKTLTPEVVDEIFHPASEKGKEIAENLAKMRS
jgi:hypothetical protein